jgi:DNA-binding transcriptional LysR family regulator
MLTSDRGVGALDDSPADHVAWWALGCLLATLRGGGLATIMPQAAASEITGLKAIQLLPPIASRTVSVLRRDGAYRTAASRAFVRMLEASDWASLRGDPPAAA